MQDGPDAAPEKSRTTTDSGAKGTARPDRARAPAEDDATEDEARDPTLFDPESPGATIDSPTPAEPNEPG